MKAHIVHDKDGTIRSTALQTAEIEGELEIESLEEGEFVTVVDLGELFPDAAAKIPGAGCENSGHRLHLIASSIREGFRIDVKRKTLVRRKEPAKSHTRR